MDSSALEIELLQLALSPSDDPPHAHREIVCRRPYREGGLRLDAEQRPDGRCLIHCYGHGGTGWTLAPGCGQRIRDLVLRHFERRGAESRDVTILGGGVMGLFAAFALAEHRAQHPGSIGALTIVAERLDDLTSHNAGGLFEPFSIGAEPDLQLLVDSYTFYQQIVLGEPPAPEFEAFDIELLSLFSSERDPMPNLAGLGYVPHGLPARMRIGDVRHNTHVHRIFFMDVALLMRHLLAVVTRRGVRILRGVRVHDLDELKTPVVVECAGLAARDLVDDPGLKPMLGHLIRLQNQPRGLLDVEHDLHVMADQVDAARAAVSAFLAVGIEDVLATFSPDGAAPDDLVNIRFQHGFEAPVRARLEPFYDVLRRVQGRLETDAPLPDPDMAGRGRVRVFDSGSDRNRYVDGIALIARVAELRGASALHDRSNQLLAALIPRFAKRFGFIVALDSGLSYFLPILKEPVVPEADGRFRYISERAANGPVTAGVVGGTTIDREDLSLEAHQREFAGVVDRFHSLGFS
ncbi:FAD-dependent oxidoreductase [Bauldia sp.]|uniref:FAD-dependent oxidoreductase n=1 Tax=Bauldia sp. TaxID=2575872 RepID=UPI003BACD743